MKVKPESEAWDRTRVDPLRWHQSYSWPRTSKVGCSPTIWLTFSSRWTHAVHVTLALTGRKIGDNLKAFLSKRGTSGAKERSGKVQQICPFLSPLASLSFLLATRPVLAVVHDLIGLSQPAAKRVAKTPDTVFAARTRFQPLSAWEFPQCAQLLAGRYQGPAGSTSPLGQWSPGNDRKCCSLQSGRV